MSLETPDPAGAPAPGDDPVPGNGSDAADTAPRAASPCGPTGPRTDRNRTAPRAERGAGVRRTSLIDRVIDRLRREIGSGTWAVGSRIPTEPELVALTGTGRNTVREAVQALVHSGLLERRQGSGTYVVADSELSAAVGRRVAGARQRDVLEVRRTLEVGAARLAAGRRTPEDGTRMRELLAQRARCRAAGDTDGFVAADVQLHLTIAETSRNPVLAELYRDLLEAISENVAFNVAHLDRGGDDDHVDLVTAIIDGDPDAAAAEAARFLDDLLDQPAPAGE